MDRRAAGALLALAACIVTSTAAPTADNTALEPYDEHSEGCYYNFQHYGEGDRIMTNEPCLNCTCHNRMLMCYLRVCPFTKAIGQDCTVEKRADQCCPIVTCPDVPVDLLTSTTTSPAEYGGTGVGKVDNYGCTINGKYFPEGAKVPPTPNKPCEHCYCIRNMTTCVMQECTLHVDGCTPIYHKDVCCPVRYFCDHPEDEMLLLDDKTTTVRPTEGFLLTTTTTEAPTTASARRDCIEDGQLYPDGALIKTEKPCEHCYCMKGDIVCVVQECGTPMENEGKNCTSIPPREGQCCPDTYICEGDELTSEPSTKPALEELTTMPSRRDFEGSGYRNEDDANTEIPTIATDIEGSGEEEMEQKPIDDLLRPGELDDRLKPAEEDEFILKTTLPPVSEDVKKTTAEPDKGLNTVPSEDELETSTKLPEIETKATEPTSVKEQDLTPPVEDESSKPLPEATEPTTEIKTTEATLAKEQTTTIQESSQPSGIETTPKTEEIITEPSIIEEHDTEAPIESELGTEPSVMREPSQTEKLSTTEPSSISLETVPSSELEHGTEPPVATTTPSDVITMGPSKDEVAEGQTTEPEIMKLTTTSRSIEKESTEITPPTKLDVTEPAPIHEQNTVPVDTEDVQSSEPSVVFKTTVSDDLHSTESPVDSVHSASPEEVSSEQSLYKKTTPQSDTVTEIAHSGDEQFHKTQSTVLYPEDVQVATTEPVFRRDGDTASPLESVTQNETEKPTTPTVDRETISTPSPEASTKAGIETKQTTQLPEESDVDITTQHKELTTEPIMELSTFAHVDDKEEIATQAPSVETISTTSLPETTSINPEDNEIAEAPSPGRIPGEGDCLIEGVTYKNESVVPSTNKCHSSCKCVSSIIKCDPIICSPPPEYMDNCQSTYDTPEACCPTYICDDGKETIPPQSHSQMSGTDSPLPTPSIDCSGDQCEILGEKQPTEIPERIGSIDCKDKDCVTGIEIPVPEFTGGCSDEKCELPLPPSKEQEKPIAETPVTCEGDSCEITPEVLPTAKEPVCDAVKGCAPASATPCEGDNCEIKPISEEPICDSEKGCKPTSTQPCDGDDCKILPEITPPLDTTESCKNEEECKQVKVPEISAPTCEGDTCTTSEGALCEGDNCIQQPDISPTEESQPCLEETGCKKPQDAPTECKGDNCGAPIPAKCTDTECLPEQPIIPTQETTQTEPMSTQPSITETEVPLKEKEQTELPERATTLAADIATEKSPDVEKTTSEPESVQQHVTIISEQPELEPTTSEQTAPEENLTLAPEVGYTATSISSETTTATRLDAQETTKATTYVSSEALTTPEPLMTNAPQEIITEGHERVTEPQVTEVSPQKDIELTAEDTERPLDEVAEPHDTTHQVEEKETTTLLPELLTESVKVHDEPTEAPEQAIETTEKEEERVPMSEIGTTQEEPAVYTTEPSLDKKEPSMYDTHPDKTKKPEITEGQETTTMAIILREGETVTASQEMDTKPEETGPILPAAETGQTESLSTESATTSSTENPDGTPHVPIDGEKTESPEKHSSTDKPLGSEYGTTESLPVPIVGVEDEVERTTQGLTDAPSKLDVTIKTETSDKDEQEIQTEPPLSLVTASKPHAEVTTSEADDKTQTTAPEMLTEKPESHDLEQEQIEKEKPVMVPEATTLVPVQETKAPEVEAMTPSQKPVDHKPIPEIETSTSVVDHNIEEMTTKSSETEQKLTELPEIYERATILPSTSSLPSEEIQKVTEIYEPPVTESRATTEEHIQPETESTTEHVDLVTNIPEQHIQQETEKPTSMPAEPEEDKVTKPESQIEITTEVPELHIRAETEQPTKAPTQPDTDKDTQPEEQGEIVTEIPESHVQAETEKPTETPAQQDEDKFTRPEKQDDMVAEVTESYVNVETEKSTAAPPEEDKVTEPPQLGELATDTPESHLRPETEKPTVAPVQTEEEKVTQPQEQIETSTYLPEIHIKEETEKPELAPSQPEDDVAEEKYTTKPESTQKATDIPLLLETESPITVTESQPHEIDEKYTTRTPETETPGMERETQSSVHEEEITTKLPDLFDVDYKFSTEPPLIEEYLTKAPEDELYTTKTPEVATEQIHTETPVARETLVTKEPDFATTEQSPKPAKEHETKPDQEHTDVPVSVVTEPQEPLTEKYEDILTEEPHMHEKDREPTESIPVDISKATESPHDKEEPSEPLQTSKPEETTSETTPYLVELEEHTHKTYEEPSTDVPAVEPTTSHEKPDQEPQITPTEKLPEDEIETELPQTETERPSDQKEEAPEQPISTFASEAPEQSTESVKIHETTPETTIPDLLDKFGKPEDEEISASTPKQAMDEEPTTPVPSQEESTKYPEPETYLQAEKDVTLKPHDVPVDTTAPEEEFIPVTTKVTTAKAEEEATTQPTPQFDKFTTPEKPSESFLPTTAPETPKPDELQPTDEVPSPEDDGQFPPSGGYNQEPDYVEEDQAFGPGTCRYGGKVYVSAQQIPRDDPCDFCFCFRSDIICLQQSCPPPIHGCHEEPIQGFCCPRYECPVSMATTLNVTTTTTTTTTTLPPHFLPHAYKGAAQRRGCQIKGHTYKVGEVVRASSGPCLHCTCGGDGQMKCDPKACTPEPMLRQMIAAAVSAKRRR